MISFDTAYIKSHTDKQLTPCIKHMFQSERITMLHFSENLKPNEVLKIFQYLRVSLELFLIIKMAKY